MTEAPAQMLADLELWGREQDAYKADAGRGCWRSPTGTAPSGLRRLCRHWRDR